MMSFRKKILFSDFALFLLFSFVIFLFLGNNLDIMGVGTLILLIYAFVTAMVVLRFSWPIQYIVNTIAPYQDEKMEYLPHIAVPGHQGEEFVKLAATLNSLTQRIRKQIETLKTQRKETEGILESLGEGVIAVDTSGIIKFANKVACNMLDMPYEEVKGKSFSRAPLHSKCHEMALQALQTSEMIEQTWTEPSAKGILFFDLFSAPLAGQNGAIIVLQDKTADHKLMEMGKDFIANASHELRTPITILRGFAEMLQDGCKLSPAILSDIGGKIVKTCCRLEKLVKSLLTLTDIENFADEKLYPCDLISIAENCRHSLLAAHPEVCISFEKSLESLPILADGDLVEMAIMNLLENAVRYSSSPAHIHLSTSVSPGSCQLVVSDLGIGIPESDLPHIFNRFYTVDKARSRKSGGAGLGLSIVKTIMEKHKGKVTATSLLHKGSQFTLAFPMG